MAQELPKHVFFKFKSLVLFIKIVRKLLLLRPFSSVSLKQFYYHKKQYSNKRRSAAAALVSFSTSCAALNRGRRLLGGGAFSSKYGKLNFTCSLSCLKWLLTVQTSCNHPKARATRE